MAWGDEGVTKRQFKQDSVTAWGPIGVPKSTLVTKAGIIRQLRMLQGGGTFTASSSPTASAWGPYNAYSNIQLLGNSQQAIINGTGYGLAIYNMVRNGLEKEGAGLSTSAVSLPNVTDQSFVFDGRTTSSAGINNTSWTWYLDLFVAQRVRSLGGDIGMIPMSTENAQLQFSFTPQCASVSGSTYTITNGSATDDLSNPFFGSGATATVVSPTVDLVRDMYEAVENPQDFPDFDWISQVIEESPNSQSATQWTWKQNQDAGVLARLVFMTVTSASPFGVTTDKLTGVNSLSLTYNTDIVKFNESGVEALARQRDELSYDLPQGVFYYDLLGKTLTWADVLNSYEVPAIQLQMNYSSITLNTTYNPKIIAQRFLPLRVA